MQFKLTLLALATAVAAQDLSQLPQCAAGPAIAAIGSTGCALTDFACICKDTSFLQTLQPQIEAACSPADLQKALAFASTTCASAGVTLTLPAVTTAVTSAASSAAPVTTAAVVTSSVPLGPGPVITSTASAGVSTGAAGGNGTLSTAPTPTSGSSGASTSIATGAAAALAVQGGVGTFAGALLALLAM